MARGLGAVPERDRDDERPEPDELAGIQVQDRDRPERDRDREREDDRRDEGDAREVGPPLDGNPLVDETARSGGVPPDAGETEAGGDLGHGEEPNSHRIPVRRVQDDRGEREDRDRDQEHGVRPDEDPVVLTDVAEDQMVSLPPQSDHEEGQNVGEERRLELRFLEVIRVLPGFGWVA